MDTKVLIPESSEQQLIELQEAIGTADSVELKLTVGVGSEPVGERSASIHRRPDPTGVLLRCRTSPSMRAASSFALAACKARATFRREAPPVVATGCQRRCASRRTSGRGGHAAGRYVRLLRSR
jgi:hypothetical protein